MGINNWWDKEGKLTDLKIIVDSKTGVNYLYTWDGYAGGVTVLWDKEDEQ